MQINFFKDLPLAVVIYRNSAFLILHAFHCQTQLVNPMQVVASFLVELWSSVLRQQLVSLLPTTSVHTLTRSFHLVLDCDKHLSSVL